MSILKKIDPISVPAIENSLAVFDLLPTTVAFNQTYIRELLPLMTVTREGPYTFRLFSDTKFIDFTKTWFFMKYQIERKDGNNWVALNTGDAEQKLKDSSVNVIQNFASSFIKQLKVTINSTLVFDSGNLYPYRAYIATEFGTSKAFREGLLEAGGYFPDEADKYDFIENEGFIKRKKYFASNKPCHAITRLNFDLANQNSLFLNNCDIIFEIKPQSDDFVLHVPKYPKTTRTRGAKDGDPEIVTTNYYAVGGTYRINLHEVKLYITLVDVVQSLQNQIARQLEHTPAKYPLRKIDLRSLYLPMGMTNFTWNVFTSIVPRRLMIFLVPNKRFDGDRASQPFKFVHGDIQNIWVEANNMTVPNNPYHLNMDEGDNVVNSSINNTYLRAFVDFYTGLDLIDQEKAVCLNMAKYLNGWTGWVFPLGSSFRDMGDSFELIKNGTTVVKGLFNKPVPNDGYMLIAVGEFDEVLTVNADRILSIDSSV